ncbi:XdhC family protein [Paracoccus sp. R12_1]|uniref:XdhC family protein n=1 Tax=Paracoccus sp. TaxID=267 RepID=UPI001AFDA90A|nr:XdhC family protein [Paracoccus sp. R12_1]
MSGMITDPFVALAVRPGGALALLIRAEGGFPRRPGAVMALWPDGSRIGRLGAGCIDADIAAHLEGPDPVKRLIYGVGGPVDLPLPCGGTVEIALIRNPDPDWLNDVMNDRRVRTTGQWTVDLTTGRAARDPSGRHGPRDSGFHLTLPPPCAVHIHGNGDEAEALAGMLRGLGLDCHLGAQAVPVDQHTAVVTLFHDHDRELAPLKAALQSAAFYVGALGSRRAQLARLAALREAGLTEAQLVRLRGPIGVVAPVREPKLLAASVLTEILAAYEQEFG